jgi:hypothetical protein
MMMMRTAQIRERHVVQGAVLAMAVRILTVRVTTTQRAVRKEPAKGREHRIECRKELRLRMDIGNGRGK